ncbi:MAG: adenylate/guanylate cyclase domain-containing protein [Actinomycetota bacterium]
MTTTAMSSKLPTGTITFLFSDIEGSTRLLQALGERYDEVIADHNRILRAAFARYGGSEMGTEGDSFFVVFASSSSAVKAAIDAQRGLESFAFPGGAAVRVRMGIHTGDGRLVGGDYRGMDVHRAARIAAAAVGGQILVSAATRALAQNSADGSFNFADLGKHRLKDLDRAVHLYQVSAQGLEQRVVVPRSLGGHPNNLPCPTSSFIGRELELRDLAKRLGDNRLVTLTGTGGTGKSRLAVHLGADLLERFDDGVYVVFLAAITDPKLVASAVAQALGVQRQGVTSMEETVFRHLSGKRMLLILDNFEHLLGAAGFVSDLLSSTRHLRILVTSRAALRISAEQEYPVPAMSLPSRLGLPDPMQMELSEAVRLFLQRARAVRPEFELTPANAPAVREICLKLDGLPLALELAAARIRTLEPSDLARRLNRSLDLLTGGARDLPGRQQTLRNTVAWSYDLLDEPHRRLLAQLGVFAGGFSLEAAEAVCCDDALDLLEGLAEHSLVKATTTNDGTRYLLLQPVREFALEILEQSGEASATREKHAQFFLAMLQKAERFMQGPAQVEWLERLEAENDNLRGALAWALESGRTEIAARIAWGMWMFWWLHGYHQEGRRSIELLLAQNPTGISRTMALAAGGNMALVAGDHQAAQAWFRECIALARQIDDKVRLAVSLQSLGMSSLNSMDLQVAVECLEEALPFFTAFGNDMMVSGIHTHLGTAALLAGDTVRAKADTEQGLAVARRSGDPVSTYFALYNLAQVALAHRDFEAAAPLLREGLTLVRNVGNQARITYFLESLAMVEGQGAGLERAARLLGASAALRAAGEVATFNYLTPSRDLYRGTLAGVRRRMGEGWYDETVAEGRQLTLSQAVDYALEGAVPVPDGDLMALLA